MCVERPVEVWHVIFKEALAGVHRMVLVELVDAAGSYKHTLQEVTESSAANDTQKANPIYHNK